mgnify:CR=1 FL=1
MRTLGIILAGGNSKRMRELTKKRAIAAMPMAMAAMGMLRVRNSATLKTAMTPTERSV